MSRFEILFSLRYAERVLERYAKFYRRLDTLIRFLALLSGSAALAALFGDFRAATLALALFFALVQALEFSLAPARIAAEAWAARKPYTAALSRQRKLSDEQLEQAWRDALAEDAIIIPEVFRRAAYNDVLEEKGCSPEYAYPRTWPACL
jgi:hypothetical protein